MHTRTQGDGKVWQQIIHPHPFDIQAGLDRAGVRCVRGCWEELGGRGHSWVFRKHFLMSIGTGYSRWNPTLKV